MPHRKPRAGRASAGSAQRSGGQRALDHGLGSRQGREPLPRRHGCRAAEGQPRRDAGALQPPQRPRGGPLARGVHACARHHVTEVAGHHPAAGARRACLHQGREGAALQPRRRARRARPQVRCDGELRPVGAPRLLRRRSCESQAVEYVQMRSKRDTPDDDPLVGGHMHLLGKSIRVELNPGTEHARVLLDIPRWDFHWQGAYSLKEPVEAKPGDVLRVTCRYDPRCGTMALTGFRRRLATCSGARGRRTRVPGRAQATRS